MNATSNRRKARTTRITPKIDAKHPRGANEFGLDRFVRQRLCYHCHKECQPDPALRDDYYSCAICDKCKAKGLKRHRCTEDTLLDLDWKDYPLGIESLMDTGAFQ